MSKGEGVDLLVVAIKACAILFIYIYINMAVVIV